MERGQATCCQRRGPPPSRTIARGRGTGLRLAERRHRLNRPCRARACQPVVELFNYLGGHGFTCYIASGGGRDFMRTISEELYGIPRDRVIGSSVALAYRDDGDVAQRDCREREE